MIGTTRFCTRGALVRQVARIKRLKSQAGVQRVNHPAAMARPLQLAAVSATADRNAPAAANRRAALAKQTAVAGADPDVP